MRISLTTILYLPLVFIFIIASKYGFPVGWFVKVPFIAAIDIIMYSCFGILLLTDILKSKGYSFHWLRLGTIIISILVILGTAVFFQISIRHNQNIYPLIHDGAQMTETAGEMLWQGKNPYSENFENTQFGRHNDTSRYGYENPAWHYYIYPPFYTLFSATAQKISLWLIGWYDLRFILILCFAFSLYILYRLIPDKEEKALVLLLFSFNPVFVFYFIAGYNDIFPYFFLILTFYLLLKEKISWSALALGLAFLSKQLTWPVLPFYLLYLIKRNGGNFKLVLKEIWPLYLTLVLFLFPFLIWSPLDFLTDTILYSSNTSQHIFPIHGNGFSMILLETGLIKDWLDYFPFWLFQLGIGLPLLFFLLRFQAKNNTVSQLASGYTFFIFVYLFFNRFFNPNYVGFISLLLISAWAVSKYEKNKKAGTQ